MLTQSILKQVLSYHPETGIFIWKYRDDRNASWNARFAGKPAGTVMNVGYVTVRINGSAILAHRLAWLYMTGDFPPSLVDHVNGVRDDNRWTNLRAATRSQNAMNSARCSEGKGVYLIKGMWVAQITVASHHRVVARCERREDAINARQAAVVASFGEYKYDHNTQ